MKLKNKQIQFAVWLFTAFLLLTACTGNTTSDLPSMQAPTPSPTENAEALPESTLSATVNADSQSQQTLSPTPTAPLITPTPAVTEETPAEETPAVSPLPLPTISTTPTPTSSTENKEIYCSLIVRCDTVSEKQEERFSHLPTDGNLLTVENVVAYDGESAFHLLSRELKKKKIHFEFSKNPTFNSVYIEGIANLYEFDCGDGSGWLYRVNGKMQSRGCSQYLLKNGDTIEFLYSCDFGNDLN